MAQASDTAPRPIGDPAERFEPLTPMPWRDRFLAVALAVFFVLVTKGPLFRLRFELAPVTVDFIDDPWVQAASLSSALIVVALGWPAWPRILRDRPVIVAFAVFSAVLVASTLWSVTWSRTAEQTIMFVLGTAAALVAGARLGRVPVLLALWSAMQFGILASLLADVRSWPLAVDYNGDLAGVYFNRNSLGPVALLGAISSVVLAVAVCRGRNGRALAVVLGGVAVLDGSVWWRSGSLTPVVAAVAASCVVAIAVLFVRGPHERRRRRWGVALGSVAVVSLVAAIAAWPRLADSFDRSTTLSGRTTIWDVVLDFVAERPVQGWGFMAVWRQSEILVVLTERDELVYEAHSGYLEVLLGAGLMGLVALLVVVGVVAARSASAMYSAPNVLTVFAFWLVVYAALVNIGETYVGANLLPWVLLAVVAGQSIRRRPPIDDHGSVQ